MGVLYHNDSAFRIGGNAALRHMSIDIETYSSIPIAKAGAYKYAQSPDFEILLFAYNMHDNSPTTVIDLTSTNGELPDGIIEMLRSPEVIKHAYNASFEWYCLSKWIGCMLPVDQWRDTMLHGMYCGYPAGLDAVGRALGLPEEQQKLATGKALIRYFCIPCKPAKTNGGRERNFPHHDPAKWELFKTYCGQDVDTEMEVERRLSRFPVPDIIQKQWQTDLTINTRGVAADLEMADGALAISAEVQQKLTDEAIRLSGLSNPNSIAQLTAKLQAELGEDAVPDLKKKTIANLIEDDGLDDKTRRILEIRQELGKTSTKKYNAVEACACNDGRIRGLLQFYGANRTGRWAGRLLQVQNLPRTYIGQLDLARRLVKEKKAKALELLYGPVQDTLSQLVRTVLIPGKGNVFVDADFSAIEARVVSWLAGEEWRLGVFRTHGKIYEASASQMFHVPIEKITKGNPEYALRQKGKIAELALGYGGSIGALKAMGALEMGLTEEELPDIVQRWRQANSRIRDLWYETENAALETVRTGISKTVGRYTLSREIDKENKLDFLTILLPSGRKLYYAQPRIGQNHFGSDSITYMGVDQTNKKWSRIETFGGKIVENVTQAVARDCLAEAIERLESMGYEIVFHVHDEVIIDCPRSKANLQDVVRIMTDPISWAKDLPLGADGWIGEYFRKD